MLEYIKAIFSVIEVLLLSMGVIPVDTNIDYGGGDYIPPSVINEMVIVEDGNSDYFIVTSENPDECIKTAANELQTYIEKVSGAELEIITEGNISENGKAILIGETQLEKEIIDIDRSSIKADGFRLYSDGKYFVIAGADSRGTLYGVYTFLEDYLGVRWFTPTLEVVPNTKT